MKQIQALAPPRRQWLNQCLEKGMGGATILAVASGLAPSGLIPVVFAQATSSGDFPNKSIRLVCGFSPGGSGDTLARTMQPELARILGQPFLIENKPGAASNIASETVARSAADGYALLLGGSFSHSVNPVLFSNLPFDPIKDFVPIYFVGGAPSVFVVPASLPVNSLAEFVAYAKVNQVNYASAGIGSPGHIAGAYFNKIHHLDMVHVVYKGSGEAVRDLIAGQVQLNVSSIASVLPMAKAGRLKVLALTGTRKARSAPEVPTSAEAGLKQFDLDGWYGIFAPAGTPPAIVSKLHAAFKQTLETPAVLEKLLVQGIEPVSAISTEAFGQFVRADQIKWREIVKLSGASTQ